MKSTLFLLFFTTCNIQAAVSRLKCPAWDTTARLNEKNMAKRRAEFDSRVDLCALENLKTFIYKELRAQFQQNLRIHKGQDFSSYLSMIRLEDSNFNGQIQLSKDGETAIYNFIVNRHLSDKKYPLTYESIIELIIIACKDCAISDNSSKNIINKMSALLPQFVK